MSYVPKVDLTSRQLPYERIHSQIKSVRKYQHFKAKILHGISETASILKIDMRDKITEMHSHCHIHHHNQSNLINP